MLLAILCFENFNPPPFQFGCVLAFPNLVHVSLPGEVGDYIIAVITYPPDTSAQLPSPSVFCHRGPCHIGESGQETSLFSAAEQQHLQVLSLPEPPPDYSAVQKTASGIEEGFHLHLIFLPGWLAPAVCMAGLLLPQSRLDALYVTAYCVAVNAEYHCSCVGDVNSHCQCEYLLNWCTFR